MSKFDEKVREVLSEGVMKYMTTVEKIITWLNVGDTSWLKSKQRDPKSFLGSLGMDSSEMSAGEASGVIDQLKKDNRKKVRLEVESGRVPGVWFLRFELDGEQLEFNVDRDPGFELM